jgi:RNA polymerase sigma-70 factor (ECF subfamily)
VKASDIQQRGLARVIAAFQMPLLRYAARLMNNVTLAQDVVQNAWIKLSKRVPPVEEPSDEVRSWLYTVVHNEAVDLIRAEERQRKLHEAFSTEQGTEALPETGLDEREALVLSCLSVLSPLQQQVVLLRLQQGLNYEAIAQIIGEKPGYVGNLLHHAVKLLGEEVKRKEGGEHELLI